MFVFSIEMSNFVKFFEVFFKKMMSNQTGWTEQENSRSILRELGKLFGNYLEPIRPSRKYPRIKKRMPNVKYYTLTNYKRAL